MIPIEIEPINFLAYRNPGPLSFEGIHVACLTGPNGAGKSSLLDAMTWAVWGKARGSSPDDLVHQIHDGDLSPGSRDMRVSFSFRQDGQIYRVIRQRKSGKRGASLLEFQVWNSSSETWHPLSEGTIRATQKKIGALIRLDYETFINSALLIQGRADEFTTKTPAQRKQVLSNILALSRWEDYEQRAKDIIVEIKTDLQRLDGRLEELDKELSLGDVHKIELEKAEIRAVEIATELSETEKVWADLEGARTELVSLQRQIDDATRRISSFEREVKEAESERKTLAPQANREVLQAALAEAGGSLDALAPIKKQLDDVHLKKTARTEEAAHLRGINTALGPETEPIKTRVKVLSETEDPSCPTCGQPLTEEHRYEVIAELQGTIEIRRDAFRINRERIEALEVEIGALNSKEKKLSDEFEAKPRLEKKMIELSSALSRADEAEQRMLAQAERIERWKKDINAESESRKKSEDEVRKAEQRLRSATLTQGDIDKLRVEKRMADERVGGARQKMNALQSYAEQRDKCLQEREQQAGDLGVVEELRDAFGKRGVPAMIIETVVPELERSATELLHRLTEGRMNVRIETQRETKSGEVREALDIIISDELGSRPYEMYSGGEAFRINFAIRIALSQLLARRAGAQLRSLFIDEGFGTQDARGREQLVAAINTIQDDFDLIIVITHIDELKDAFPTRIEVEKTSTGSRYRLT
jgi:exonuclease SbcC